MKPKLPTRRMREHPDLEQLKRLAKELLRAYSAGDPAAAAEVNAHYHDADPAKFALHDAQLVIARGYGFESWPKLKAYVDGVTVRRFADAIRAGDLPLVQSMLRARPEIADMQMSYGDEHRPIHFAIMYRSAEIVRLLMQHGADIHYGIHPHREATSPLTIAKERGFDEIVAIIEEEDAKRTVKAEEQPTPPEVLSDEAARTAVASGDIEWIRARLVAGKLEYKIYTDNKGGLLTVAVKHDQPQMLRLLLENGFDPDERISWGEGDWVAYSQGYPLWLSAARGRRELAEILLNHGANPNAQVDSSGSSVYAAFSHKQWDMVELLRSRGGLVSAATAALYRRTDLAQRMLADYDRGVLDPGVATEKPLVEELLHFGADGGAVEIVRMALERIDWARDDPRWFGPVANPMCFWHHIPWLYAGNKEFDQQSYLTCFRMILKRADPNLIAGFSRTLLHEAASTRDHISDEYAGEFARSLLQAGARPDVRDQILRSTPLGWACRWGRASVVAALLEHGADAIEPDAEPWASPEAWASKMGHDAIVDMLRQHRGAQ